jgi:hypothetical protein
MMVDVQQFNVTKNAADASAPSGVWAGAPSLAASTVEMENTSGFPVVVEVVGGTVTVVKVNGTTTGITAGSFRVRVGETLAITYSVAPTLTWTYDAPRSFRPAGTWAGAPALAASTVAMTNTSGYDVEVGISSGTVTVVKKNGVTLTAVTTPASVRLRPGHTLAITYSVAPTLQWIYA